MTGDQPTTDATWLNVQVAPMESWADPMRRLTDNQRERLETPEFYELLQREISRRFTPEMFRPV
ncbi:MAG: hypothetical protein O3B95_12090 [Chloroflexi bacterium]|nr:hypothetical protein [Chloroflexota bacterium]